MNEDNDYYEIKRIDDDWYQVWKNDEWVHSAESWEKAFEWSILGDETE